MKVPAKTRRQKVAAFMNHPVTNIIVMFLIVGSIVMLVVELAAENEDAGHFLIINRIFVAVFVVELGLRYYAETKKRRFFRQYWLDILAVMPFLRLLRVLRVFRLMSAFRFGLAMSRRMGWINASLQREAVQWFAVAIFVFIVVLFGAIGLQLAEPGRYTFSETTWWAVMSLIAGEPIGPVPDTSLGRLVAVGVMIAGLTVFAMLTGVISAMMVHRLGNIDTRAMDIDELEEHIVICGWNRSGSSIIEELQSDPDYKDRRIVVVGEFEERPTFPDTMPLPDNIYIVKGDFTRLDVLEKAGLARASHAIVLADRLVERSDQDRDARSVLTSLLIERIKRSIFTSVELLNRDNESFLRTVGVDEIVVGTDYAASILATSTRNHGIVKVFDELLTSRYGSTLYKAPLPEEFDGQTYGDLVTRLKQDHDMLLIGVEHLEAASEEDARVMEMNPPCERVLRDGDQLVVIAAERPDW